MPDVIYAHLDGRDHERRAATVRPRLETFVRNRSWGLRVYVVDHRIDASWNLGIDIEVPTRSTLQVRADIEAIADFLGELARETDRDIIVGLALEDGPAEDLFGIPGDQFDRSQFRALFEPPAEPPELDKFVYRTVPFDFEDGKPVAVDGRRRIALDFLGGFLLQRACWRYRSPSSGPSGSRLESASLQRYSSSTCRSPRPYASPETTLARVFCLT